MTEDETAQAENQAAEEYCARQEAEMQRHVQDIEQAKQFLESEGFTVTRADLTPASVLDDVVERLNDAANRMLDGEKITKNLSVFATDILTIINRSQCSAKPQKVWKHDEVENILKLETDGYIYNLGDIVHILIEAGVILTGDSGRRNCHAANVHHDAGKARSRQTNLRMLLDIFEDKEKEMTPTPEVKEQWPDHLWIEIIGEDEQINKERA